jgi:protein-tyrosine phosphatase
MIPLVDMHCHLCAGFDDGPKTWEDVLTMCRMLCEEGAQMVAALAHQNEDYPDNSAQRIREGVKHLVQLLQQEKIPLRLAPTGEVMIHIDMESAWSKGDLLSVADRKQYLLVEMPHQTFVELGPLVGRFQQAGLNFILAHAERQPEFLHDAGRIEELIHAGCLVQVNSGSVINPRNSTDEKALKSWFQRGCVHLLGSDGHSSGRRAPRLAGAYQKIMQWAGEAVADRVCSTNGVAVLNGLPLRVPPPQPKAKASWFKFW